MAEIAYAPDPRPTPLQFFLSRGYGPARTGVSSTYRAPLRITTPSSPRFTVDDGTNTVFQVYTAAGGAAIIYTNGFTWMTFIDANTTSAPVGAEFYHQVTGTAGSNVGISVDFRSDTASGSRTLGSRFSVFFNNSNPATSNLRMFILNAGASLEVLRLVNDGLYVFQTKVIGARQTGWVTLTGTATTNAGAFDTGSVTLPQLAQVVKAVVDGLLTHGLIGA